MLARRLFGALAVCLGTIGFMAIGLKGMAQDDYVYVYDANQGSKYRVKRENYNRNTEEKQKRFMRRHDEMKRRQHGFVDEDQYRIQKMGENKMARYRPTRAQRFQEMKSGSRSISHDPRDDDRVQMIKYRQRLLQDKHNQVRSSP